MLPQSPSDSSQDPQERSLRRRLAWRRRVLEVLGIALVVAGIMVNWPAPEDSTLPSTRPFVVLLGVLVFMAGLALERQRSDRENRRSGNT